MKFYKHNASEVRSKVTFVLERDNEIPGKLMHYSFTRHSNIYIITVCLFKFRKRRFSGSKISKEHRRKGERGIDAKGRVESHVYTTHPLLTDWREAKNSVNRRRWVASRVWQRGEKLLFTLSCLSQLLCNIGIFSDLSKTPRGLSHFVRPNVSRAYIMYRGDRKETSLCLENPIWRGKR